VASKWLPEIHHRCKGVPYLLVGIKTDLKQNQNNSNPNDINEASSSIITTTTATPSTIKEGKEIAKSNKSIGLFECSTLISSGSYDYNIYR
jgi:GTPase SAR1 family protein